LQAEPLDEVSLKKLLLQFEKRLYRNQELRIKFPDMPEKYVVDALVAVQFITLLVLLLCHFDCVLKLDSWLFWSLICSVVTVSTTDTEI